MNKLCKQDQNKCSAIENYSLLMSKMKESFPKPSESQNLALNAFMDIESVLALSYKISKTCVGTFPDVSKANLLLSNYALLRPESFAENEHLMQMARRWLLPYSSSFSWATSLERYCGKEFDEIRLFVANEEGEITLNEKIHGGEARVELYCNRILEPRSYQRQSSTVQPEEEYSYNCQEEVPNKENSDWTSCVVTLPKNLPEADKGTSHKPIKRSDRKPITITVNELIATAEHLKNTTGKEYYYTQLMHMKDSHLLRSFKGTVDVPCDELTLQEVTNLVGMVGSGKSVLSTVLIVALAQRGYRVAVLMNAVSEVFESVVLLCQAGVEASPLISKNKRLKYLNQLHEGQGMLLDEKISDYLETPCVIDGIKEDQTVVCSYADRPCKTLTKKKSKVVCPYWDVCPSQAMAREACCSQVVVTTPSGFVMTKVGSAQRPFFELTLSDFDLVIFDEADRIQGQLDQLFAPTLSFQQLIRDASQPTQKAMSRKPSDKMNNYNEEHFFDLLSKTEQVAKSLIQARRKESISTWTVVKKEAFTSMSLLERLREEGLPERLVKDMEELITKRTNPSDELLAATLAGSCPGIDDTSYQITFNLYLKSLSEKDCDLTPELGEKLSFLIRIIYFDQFLQNLTNSYDSHSFTNESLATLNGLLRFSLVDQQRYLPSSVIGNLFGFQAKGDNDLILFRQFAFGRAFLTSLPWLETTAEGKPAGPHALLLSGSSYEPGCFSCHINKPIDYLLESQEWKTQKIKETLMVNMNLGCKVSGSMGEKREKNLRTALKSIAENLCRDLDDPSRKKVLIIVNSYVEAQNAKQALDGALCKLERFEKTCCLIDEAPTQNKTDYIARSDLEEFYRNDSRILIAPAMAIERGFNIVDERGQAVFTSLFFAVRPMAAPFDLGARMSKLNGITLFDIDTYSKNSFEFARDVRKKGWKNWKRIESCENMPLNHLMAAKEESMITDVVANLMVTIVQIFGRLARFNNESDPVPRVYFVDGAFGGKESEDSSFNTVKQLEKYLEFLIEDSAQSNVAKALYGPFYESFKNREERYSV